MTVKSAPPTKEFIVLMAFMMSVSALTIDMMLPALADMRRDLGVENPNHMQLVVSFMFIGLAIGKVIYGPLSDSIGRKMAILYGVLVFLVGCLICIVSTDFYVLLGGRVLQGVGGASLRVVITALIRDKFEGSEMAKTMSLITSIFVFVPAIAPALGEAVLYVSQWRVIFIVLFTQATIGLTWLWTRQEETLVEEKRVPYSLMNIVKGSKEALRTETTMRFMLTAGLVFGSFIGYLNSSPQLFKETFKVGRAFPIYFGCLALTLGLASFMNSKLVNYFELKPLCKKALIVLTVNSALFLLSSQYLGSAFPVWAFMFFMLIVFFCVGVLFGNMYSIALEPLGHIAGLASAILGSFQTIISVIIGITIGQFYDGTPTALAVGFLVTSLSSYLVIRKT